MAGLFGTDGVRGEFGTEPITPETVMKLGWAVGSVLSESGANNLVLIGKDTRISGYILESALEAGFASAGVNVALLGPMPTPGIAYLTRTARAAAGVVVSASHNPYHDNGIKFFSSKGFKLNDALIAAGEEKMSGQMKANNSDNLGKATRFPDAIGRYIEFCKHSIPYRVDFNGLKVVLDCANGAAYNIAPQVFEELGAEVIKLGVSPDGYNINQGCGSTDLSALQTAVIENQADIGIALDGDADRVLFVDASGEIVDGDQTLYLIAIFGKQQGTLGEGVVGTLMTNLGFEKAMEQADIKFARANVGDRYVLEMLQANNWILGGETSGHIICLDKNTTGDGTVAALQVLRVMQRTGNTLAELVKGMSKFPQKMINVTVARGQGQAIIESASVKQALSDYQAQMGNSGRIVLRPSGTEPLVRVMVEGEDQSIVEIITAGLAKVVEETSDRLST
jgi:phosphoglucosamine mutase